MKFLCIILIPVLLTILILSLFELWRLSRK